MGGIIIVYYRRCENYYRCGNSSGGKTSLLLFITNYANHRIITEDTLELPVAELRRMSYDILSMKVRSSLSGESKEVSATGIRASLLLEIPR